MIEDKSSKSQQLSVAGKKHTTRQRKRWQLEQTIRYCEFIKKNRPILEFTQKKQKQKIYNRMSEYIGTRSTHQCRSHHQKILKRFNSIDGFIQNFTEKIHTARNLADWSQTQLEGIQCLRILEKEKNNNLYSKKPFKSELLHKQLRNVSDFNSSQLTPLQLLPHFSSLNTPKYQFPHDQLSFYNQSHQFSKPHPPNLHKSIENQHLYIAMTQNRHLDKQNSKFYVPSPAIKEPRSKNNDNEASKYEFNAQSHPFDNLQFSKDFQFPNHAWKMKEFGRQPHEGYQPSNRLPYSEGFRLLNSQRFSNHRLRNPKSHDVMLPPYQQLKEKPQQRINKASQICRSIMYKKNLNVISPLIKDNEIELTTQMIKIKGKEQDNYKYWIECENIQKLHEDSEEMDSESEEIQREVVEEILGNVLVDFGIIPQEPGNQFYPLNYFNPSSSFNRYYNSCQYPIKATQQFKEFQHTLKPDSPWKYSFNSDLIEQQLHEDSQSSGEDQISSKLNQRLAQPLIQPLNQTQKDKFNNPYERIQKTVEQKKRAYYQFCQRLEQKKGKIDPSAYPNGQKTFFPKIIPTQKPSSHLDNSDNPFKISQGTNNPRYSFVPFSGASDTFQPQMLNTEQRNKSYPLVSFEKSLQKYQNTPTGQDNTQKLLTP